MKEQKNEQRHSRAYHRYFENYAEKQIIDEKGKLKIERVYVGQYYRADLSEAAQKKRKIEIGVLFFLTLAGYLFGALTARVSAYSVVAAGTMPPLIALLFLGISVFYRLSAPAEMEIRTYRDSSLNLIRNSLAFLICIAVCFALTLIFSLILDAYTFSETLPALAGYLISLLASLRIYLLEKSTSYIILDPKHKRPDKSSPIRYEMPD